MKVEKTVIALGFFDGVHRGHGALLRKAAERAGELGAVPAVFTFDRSPREFVTGTPVPLLNSNDDRRDIIRRVYGIERVIFARFDQAMMTMGWEDYIYQMLVVDYLILNRDRHGANIEVLRNSQKKTVRLAPMFDHGLSLLCSCPNDAAAAKFDVMADKPCNNYIGSKSAWDNLHIIPKDKMPELHPLHESDRQVLLEGLDGVISPTLQDKIWEMIWKRWCAYEDFCNSR